MPASSLLRALLGAVVLFSASSARAATLRVPSQFPTIQAAVDAASDGDSIRVARGRHCGATLTKRVTLEGRAGARIIGCAGGPALANGARIGFFLPGVAGVNPASGTQIRGFVFDGEGIGNANLEPLALGVFARFANDIVVSRNSFRGTVQAITNTAGDRWLIKNNRIERLSVFDCTRLCAGGDGIVVQLAAGSLGAPGGNAAAINRPEDNAIIGNFVQGNVPDGFGVFSMAGVLLLAADHTQVLSNDVRLRDNPAAAAVGQGILVSNTCCGLPSSFLPGSRFTTLAFNDGRRSEVAIQVEGSGGINTLGLLLHRNRGLLRIEGSDDPALAARRSAPPPLAQPFS
jgi:hypothetical protein